MSRCEAAQFTAGTSGNLATVDLGLTYHPQPEIARLVEFLGNDRLPKAVIAGPDIKRDERIYGASLIDIARTVCSQSAASQPIKRTLRSECRIRMAKAAL